ncbi:MAG TPA: hypothetical protein VNR86_02465 [Sphingomicrobium sp.]|nr:hypothetical protein [Sphingomicrobium sp.]
MPQMVSLEDARWALGKIWFIGAALIAALLIFQSLAGVYEGRTQAVWGWALPNIMPTLSLMIGVFAAAALQDHVESDSMHVRRPFFRLAMGMSAFHLIVVAATIIAQPFLGTIAGSQANPMTLFDMSNIWLGVLQGMVAAIIGALFFSKTSKSGAASANTEPDHSAPSALPATTNH